MELEGRAKDLVKVLRAQCLSRGCTGIKGLGTVFRLMDRDFSKRVCLEELKLGIRSYGLTMSDQDLHVLFSAIDKDKSGAIDFGEFMDKLRPPMNQNRVSVVNQAFHRLDVNNDNVIQLDDLKVVFASNALQHPKFRSGEWTEEETLRHFLNGLDTPGCPDGKVTREEFLSYYAGVSATVDDDCYFDLMMRTTYNLSPKGSD